MTLNFLTESKKYLESEYNYDFGFVQNVNAAEDADGLNLEIRDKYNHKLIKTIPSNVILEIFKLWDKKEFIEERNQYVWQKEIIDCIEGS